MRKSVVVLLIFLAGCVWQKTGGPFEGYGYAVDLPTGWMLKGDLRDMTVDITRDGMLLQNMHVTVRDITKHEKDEKKIIKKGMLPQEVAQVGIDILSSNTDLGQFAVLQNEPAQLGGMDGFKLVCAYRRGKVRYKSVIYGVLQGETFYRISYSAPVRYYFEKDVASFEEIIKTFKLVEKKAEPKEREASSILGAETGL